MPSNTNKKIEIINRTEVDSNVIDEDCSGDWDGEIESGYRIVKRVVHNKDDGNKLHGITVRGRPGTTVEIPDGFVSFHPNSSPSSAALSCENLLKEEKKNVMIEEIQNMSSWLDDSKKLEILIKIKESKFNPEISSYRHFHAEVHYPFLYYYYFFKFSNLVSSF